MSSKCLTFDTIPQFIGKDIKLSQQHNTKTPNDADINILNGRKGYSVSSKKLIVVCNKLDLINTLEKGYKNINLNIVSISQTQLIEYNKADIYIILMMSCNEQNKKHNIVSTNSIKLIKKHYAVNISSNNGKKHHGSFGKYYGIGLINKYKIDKGLSFGKFKEKTIKKCDDIIVINQLKVLISNEYNVFIAKLNRALPGIVDAGNTLIHSLIKGGTHTTLNNNFVGMFDNNKPISKGCYSGWICENA